MARTPFASLVLVAALGLAPAVSIASEPDDALLGKLAESKQTLLDGVSQAEKSSGPAISAKFELEDGKLMLSVYTAKEGKDKDAESNILMELGGDATTPQWTPKTEVFADKAHIARSAMQLTLLQTTKLTLADLIKKAGGIQKGTVYSAIPALRKGKPVLNVMIATPDKKTVSLILDAQTGKATK